MISRKTATDIAVAYHKIEVAEKLLDGVRKAVDRLESVDMRDVFGRRRDTLELGILSGDNGRRLLRVLYRLGIPVIETDIAYRKAKLCTLNEKARIESGTTGEHA